VLRRADLKKCQKFKMLMDLHETRYLVVFEVTDFKSNIKSKKFKIDGFKIEISVLYSESITKLTFVFFSLFRQLLFQLALNIHRKFDLNSQCAEYFRTVRKSSWNIQMSKYSNYSMNTPCKYHENRE